MALTDVSISLLVGGKSSRFGMDKALFQVNGKPLVEIIEEKFRDLTSDFFIQGRVLGLFEKEREDVDGVACPLRGIYSALLNSDHDRTFVIACDMPFIDPRLLGILKGYHNASAVVPRWTAEKIEPLSALYSKVLLPELSEFLKQGEFKISRFLEKVENVEWVDIEELMADGRISRDCFKNLNTRDDLPEGE